MPPFLSIVIPVFDSEKFIAAGLESIISANIGSVEIIMVDKGANDATKNIIRRHVNQYEFCHAITASPADHGPSTARNVGIEKASGQYILFMDDDDQVDPTALYDLIDFAKSRSSDVIHFSGQQITNDKIKIYRLLNEGNQQFNGPGFFSRALKNRKLYIQVWLYLYRREFLHQNNIRFLPHVLHEDELFVFETLNSADSVGVFNQPVYKYLRRENSYMTSTDKDHLRRRLQGCVDIIEAVSKYDDDDDPVIRSNRANMIAKLIGHVSKQPGKLNDDSLVRFAHECLKNSLRHCDWQSLDFRMKRKMALVLVKSGFGAFQ
jgi:glycosyltransferase involved in cell wall biosynthesis